MQLNEVQSQFYFTVSDKDNPVPDITFLKTQLHSGLFDC